ncbi:MAG: Rqc2 family fibronectin-binding protein [Candidatus Zipacnadales bacterium]
MPTASEHVMFFDSLMLARAKKEVERELLGARVRELLQLHHDEVVLVFRRESPVNCLWLSSSPQFGRVCLTASPPTQRVQPQSFGLALRKHLRGARLRAVSQPGFDRVLRLEFHECRGFGPEVRRTLVIEIMGKHGNMLLLDEQDRILSCAKHVPSRLNRYRSIMEGEPYVLPPTFGKLDPRTATLEAARQRLVEEPTISLDEFLQRTFLGMSKVLSKEVKSRFSATPSVASEFEAQDLGALIVSMQSIINEAENDRSVYVYSVTEGRDLPTQFAYPVRLHCCGEPVDKAEWLGEALEPLRRQEAYSRLEYELRQRLTGAVRTQLRALGERLVELSSQLRQAEKTQAQRRAAELLLAQPHVVTPYAKEVTLVDYYVEGTPTVTIELDPPGDLHGTARRMFERARRATRLLEQLPTLIEQTERESKYLESVLEKIERAERLGDLQQLAEELSQQGYLRDRHMTPRHVEGRKSGPQPRRRMSSDGYVILYGTNEAQNDALIRIAAPDDLWLHVQGAPGAHVLIRTSGHPERVPQRTLVEAAQLAGQHSRLRTQKIVDVDYTQAKHVRKPKGERGGMVYYTHQKTIAVHVT